MKIISAACLQTSFRTVCLGRKSLHLEWRKAQVCLISRKFSVQAELTLEDFVSRIHGSSTSNYDKALRYLDASSSTAGFQNFLSSNSEPSVSIPMTSEIFTPAIVYDLVSELPGINSEIPNSLLHLIESHMNECGLFNYLTDKKFNDDVDTTSVCLWALLNSNRMDTRLGKCIAKLISVNCMNDSVYANNKSESESKKSVRNVIRTYFPPYRFGGKTAVSCIDPCVMANSMRILYFYEMQDLAVDTQNFICDWLEDEKQFLAGTNYYISPDSLLYFLSNCLLISVDAAFKFKNLLKKRLEERIGKTESPMEISKRIITAFNLGLITSDAGAQNFNHSEFNYNFNEQNLVRDTLWDENHCQTLRADKKLLCELQEMDGSWPLEPFYRNHTILISNKTAVTAFAAKALFLSRYM